MQIDPANTMHKAQRTTTVLWAQIHRLWLLGLVALSVCAVIVPSVASADTTICSTGAKAGQCDTPQDVATDFETGRLYVADQHNNRVDVFNSDGSFVFAFGWGVADGSSELQSCGPAATPPTTQCRTGLTGLGAGQFNGSNDSGLTDIVVDNDPSSPSHHDVYTLERNVGGSHLDTYREPGYRVQKFDFEGNFLLTFGGGVITGGAQGTGNLSAGSTEVTGVQTIAKTFEPGQTIESPGNVPVGTKIVSVGPGTITLSKPASSSGSAVPLSVAEGPGNVPTNEVVTLVSDPSNKYGPGISLSTPSPSQSFAQSSVFDGSGLVTTLPPNASAAELQEEIEGFPNVGPGNVKVTEGNVTATEHEYTIEFTGPRFADTNVVVQKPGGTSGVKRVLTEQNGGGGAEVCAAAVAKSCSAGIDGKGHSQIARWPTLAVGPNGAVSVADCVRYGEMEDCGDRLQKFSPTGAFLEEIELPQSPFALNGLAVDSGGNFYVAIFNAIRKYDPAGNLIGQLPVTAEVGALAVDAADHLFTAERDNSARLSMSSVIAEYDPAGNTLRRFGYGVLKSRPSGLAPYKSTDGDIYSAEQTSVMHRFFPASGPIILPQPCQTKTLGNTKATLVALVNPEGKATTAHFQYVDEKSFEEEGGFSSPNTKTTPESESIGSDFVVHEALGEASVEPDTAYRCRVIVRNADVPAGVTGEEGSFTSKPPLEIGDTTVSDVGTETVTLHATVNPLGIETMGYFEYVEGAKYLEDIEDFGPGHGFDQAIKAPNPDTEEPIEFGAGNSFKVGSAPVSGLKPNTPYRFRLVATNAFFEDKGEAGIPGPTKFFRTYGASSEALPDNRAWELVSPAQKNSAEVAVPGSGGGIVDDRMRRIQAGATDGNSVTYTSWTSFGKAEGASWVSQYLSKRTEEGWATENISPYGFLRNLAWPNYFGFSTDLKFAAFKTSEPRLTADCRKNEGIYLRDSETGVLRCLDPEVSGGPESQCLLYGGASEDGTRAFLAGRPENGKAFTYSLYESTAASGPVLISVFPNGDPAPPTAGTSFGFPGSAVRSGVENCQMGYTSLRHVVSADGSRVFWTYAPANEKEPTQLFVRVDGKETLQLDKHQSGAGTEAGEGAFWTASADGSVAYFTDTMKLVSGARPEEGKPDLYRYELGKATPLVDLTKGPVPGDVQGVVGASDDGSHVYFVARAVLSEEENEVGQKATAGANNLYLFREGKTTFIARLAPEDQTAWESSPTLHSARVSPDGRHLAFLSIEAKALAGYDNTIATGEHCKYNPPGLEPFTLTGGPFCAQVFLYDAEAKRLTCASCNPSGSRPRGPAVLPLGTNPFEGPRYLSDDGQRLFFSSLDVLSPADENENLDVYEFERVGSGSCTNQSLAFDPISNGCHFLISSGKGEDESFLVDASADGRDVFISTRDSLVGWDINENFDIYDVRVGGGFPEPVDERTCEGEACVATVTAPPSFTAPPHFEGAGNPVAKPKPRHKTKHKRNRARKGKGRRGNAKHNRRGAR